jgi:hypothetical protein
MSRHYELLVEILEELTPRSGDRQVHTVIAKVASKLVFELMTMSKEIDDLRRRVDEIQYTACRGRDG